MVFSNSWHLSTRFYQKTYEVKKILWTICDIQYNILSHHREITIIKFWIKTDTWQVTDSAVWCTPWSLTPRYDADQGVFLYILFSWLRGEMHTSELDSTVWCTPGSQTPGDEVWCTLRSFLKIWISRRNRNLIRKYFSMFIRGLHGFESWKKIEVKKLVTHSL